MIAPPFGGEAAGSCNSGSGWRGIGTRRSAGACYTGAVSNSSCQSVSISPLAEEGLVSAVFGQTCDVLTGDGVLRCALRGRLRQASAQMVAGDRVVYKRLGPDEGVVEELLPRRNQLARSGRDHSRRRTGGVPKEQVILANPDQVMFVAAARDPGIHFALLDRALALARRAALPACICVNKMDIAPDEEVRRLMAPYERLGFPVLYVSALSRFGLEELCERLQGKLSFFWGGSGVGKSSLIQALTGAEVRIGVWRTDNPRGPHTTNVTRLYSVPGAGWIADTPGFDWLELDLVDDAEDPVALLLPEAAALAGDCRFPGCTHCSEAGCAVMAAVLESRVDRGRYSRFRQAMAESHPPPDHPVELLASEGLLFFRMREGNSSVWTTLTLAYLFLPARPERAGFLETLGAPHAASVLGWSAFHEEKAGDVRRSYLALRHTSLAPAESDLTLGEEVILRSRCSVIAIGRITEIRPTDSLWALRKQFKGSPVYEERGLWTDLKPPEELELTEMPEIHGARVHVGKLERFGQIPTLGLGALTRQDGQLVYDFLEVGGSEDEAARE